MTQGTVEDHANLRSSGSIRHGLHARNLPVARLVKKPNLLRVLVELQAISGPTGIQGIQDTRLHETLGISGI